MHENKKVNCKEEIKTNKSGTMKYIRTHHGKLMQQLKEEKYITYEVEGMIKKLGKVS